MCQGPKFDGIHLYKVVSMLASKERKTARGKHSRYIDQCGSRYKCSQLLVTIVCLVDRTFWKTLEQIGSTVCSWNQVLCRRVSIPIWIGKNDVQPHMQKAGTRAATVAKSVLGPSSLIHAPRAWRTPQNFQCCFIPGICLPWGVETLPEPVPGMSSHNHH